MSDNEPDRCGINPATFGGWTLAACIWHDKSYVKDSWQQKNMSRKEVDSYFLTLLLYLAKKGRFQSLKRAQAHIMYNFVRFFGGTWWEGKE